MGKQKSYTFVDLFSGAGGFSEGFLLAGDESTSYRLVAASDLHDNARLTHTRRFRDQLKIQYDFLTQDIREETFTKNLIRSVELRTGKPTVDVVVGGPPCQGFSLFGKRSEDDPRNDLFMHYIKVIQALSPKYFVMENVPGLAMMYEGKTVKKIHDAVAAMAPTKYGIVGPIKVNAANFGVPQLRERILFVGYQRGIPSLEVVHATHVGNHITVGDAIGDLAFLRAWENGEGYRPDYPAKTLYQAESREGRLFSRLGIEREDRRLLNHDAPRHTPDVIARFAMIEVGKGLESVPKELWESHLKTSKKWCVKLDPDAPSYTVVTLPDDLVHYQRNRILTVRELARLQSFDDTFEFFGPRASGGGGKGNKKRNSELPQYTQVGNAVPPLLARGVADSLLRLLTLPRRKEATNAISRTLHQNLLVGIGAGSSAVGDLSSTGKS